MWGAGSRAGGVGVERRWWGAEGVGGLRGAVQGLAGPTGAKKSGGEKETGNIFVIKI